MGLTNLISDKVLEKIKPKIDDEIKTGIMNQLSSLKRDGIEKKVREYLASEEYENKVADIIGKEMEKYHTNIPVLIISKKEELLEYKQANNLDGPIASFEIRVSDSSSKARALFLSEDKMKEKAKENRGNFVYADVEIVSSSICYIHGKVYRAKKLNEKKANSEIPEKIETLRNV